MDSTSGSRKNAKRLVFVITDGFTNLGIKPKVPANELRAPPLNAKIFVIGIGASVNEQEILDIAGFKSHAFRAKSYKELKKIAIYLGGCKCHAERLINR